jgi:hypothetical protein
MKHLKTYKQLNESKKINMDYLVSKIEEYLKKYSSHSPLLVKSLGNDNIEIVYDKSSVSGDKEILKNYIESQGLDKQFGLSSEYSVFSGKNTYTVRMHILSTLESYNPYTEEQGEFDFTTDKDKSIEEIYDDYKRNGIYVFSLNDERQFKFTEFLDKLGEKYGDTSQTGTDVTIYDPESPTGKRFNR